MSSLQSIYDAININILKEIDFVIVLLVSYNFAIKMCSRKVLLETTLILEIVLILIRSCL